MSLTVWRIPTRDAGVTASVAASNFTLTKNDIIKHALLMVGDTRAYTTEAAELLNTTIKSMQAENVFLWTVVEQVITFSAATEVIGTDGVNYTCYRNVTSSLANRPITGEEWSMYYTPAGSNGATWVVDEAHVSTGQINLDVDTLDVERAILRDNNRDYELDIISGADYASIYDKYFNGRPTSLYFEPSNPPKMFMWPQIRRADIDVNKYVLKIWRVRRLADFFTGDDSLDFDVRWLEPLIFKLAAALAWQYNLGDSRVAMLESKAKEAMNRARPMQFETVRKIATPAY